MATLLRAKAGTYVKDGATKTRYVTVGRVIESERGPMLKIDALPVGFDGWIYYQEEEGERPTNRSTSTRGSERTDDDVPF